jgi:hypothetical protein
LRAVRRYAPIGHVTWRHVTLKRRAFRVGMGHYALGGSPFGRGGNSPGCEPRGRAGLARVTAHSDGDHLTCERPVTDRHGLKRSFRDAHDNARAFRRRAPATCAMKPAACGPNAWADGRGDIEEAFHQGATTAWRPDAAWVVLWMIARSGAAACCEATRTSGPRQRPCRTRSRARPAASAAATGW